MNRFQRLFDCGIALVSLIVFGPFLILVAVFIFLADFHQPLYIAPRVGRNGRLFPMIKLRSMKVESSLGPQSTSVNDVRITKIGAWVRKFKIDELPQFWSVLIGHMSVVGPRPNVPQEVDLYSDEERKLLNVRPGITDIASIVFSDEGDVISVYENPEEGYHQLVRPWKSRLGLLYVKHRAISLDLVCCALTVVNIVHRRFALKLLCAYLRRIIPMMEVELMDVILREKALVPHPPPGFKEVFRFDSNCNNGRLLRKG